MFSNTVKNAETFYFIYKYLLKITLSDNNRIQMIIQLFDFIIFKLVTLLITTPSFLIFEFSFTSLLTIVVYEDTASVLPNIIPKGLVPFLHSFPR